MDTATGSPGDAPGHDDAASGPSGAARSRAATTVVAVHGNGGGSFRFEGSAPHVPSPVRMVAPDLPGFGGRPLHDPAPSMTTFTSALREVVEHARSSGTAVPDHRVVVLGHGIGGAIALDLLCHEPGLADGLVLHAPVGTRLDTRWFPRLMASPTVREAARRAIASTALRPVWRRTIARTMPRSTADDFLAGYDDCPAFGVMFDLLTADWFDALPTLELPAVLLWGSDDRVLDAEQRRDYHRLLPDADEVVVDGWGHFPMLADPADYAWRMAAVVAGVAARADVRDHGSPRRAVPVGSGQLDRLDVPGKAARLEALPDGLVPPAVVVPPDVAIPVAAGEVRGWLGTGDARVAVRSAFGAEDAEDRSLAGAFHSVLDVALDTDRSGHDGDRHATAHEAGRDPLADALADVRASAEAVEGVTVDDADRAVLVMAMVDAHHAGVAFLEPGFVDDLVEHVDGLADGLVDGGVEGERLELPRRELGGEAADDGWPRRLQDALAALRASAGDEAWDVEWADDGATCHVVQLRPITAAVPRDAELTLANHREILPDLPSRFMTSLIVDAGDDVFAYWQGFDEDVPRGRPFTEKFGGRPWINLSLLVDTMRVLGLPASFVTDSMGGESEHDAGLRPSRVARKAPTLARMGRDQLDAVSAAEDAVADLRALVDDLPPAEQASASDAVALARRAYVRLLLGMFPLSTAISGPLAALASLDVSAELHRRQRTDGTRVLDDLDDVRAAAHDEDDLARLVAHAGGDADGPEPSDALAAAWATYLDAHGHRGIYESDLARPRYHEDPSPLLALLDPSRSAAPDAAPDAAHADPGDHDATRTAGPDATGERHPSSEDDVTGTDAGDGARSASRRVRTVLAAPIWWQASRAMQARERLRSEAMRTFDEVRRRLLAVADAAVATGQLPEREALWDLEVDEVRALDDGHVHDEAFLADRREEQARFRALDLPDLVRRTDDPETVGRQAGDQPGHDGELRGRGLTDGNVDGNVVVLTEPGAVDHVERPRVLVARGIDAGWVSVFAHVDAVVVETGGELSHGSIVLRELGIPAVTNVRGAASALSDGDRVQVRVRSGTVRRR